MAVTTRLGRYRLAHRLGRGGLGEVYLAEADGPDGFRKRVVVKRIRAALADDPAIVERLGNEARVLSGLSHGNIVQVLDFGEDGGERFLVMEYVDGCALSTLLAHLTRTGQRMAPIEALYIADALCRALAHAHVPPQTPSNTATGDAARPRTPTIHRDVAPGNVLLSRSGEVKLADFGLSGRLGEDSDVGGTPGFAAPEQLAGQPVDARADLYGVGRLLQAMLGVGSPAQVSTGTDADAQQAPLDEDLRQILARACAHDPSDRPASADALREALEDWRAAHGVRHGSGRLPGWIEAIAQRSANNAPSVELASLGGTGPSSGPRTRLLRPAGPRVATRGRGGLVWLVLPIAAALALVWVAWARTPNVALVDDESAPAPAPRPSEPREPLARADQGSSLAPDAPPTGGDADEGPPPTTADDGVAAVPGADADAATTAGADVAGRGDDPPLAKGGKHPNKGVTSKAGTAAATTGTATLRVNLVPWALVTLDGVSIGKTPLRRPIAAGDHTLVLTNPDTGQSRTVSLHVDADGEASVTEW